MEFTLPEDLGPLSAEDLAAKQTEASGLLDALLALEDPSDSDVADAEALTAALERIDEATKTRATAASERTTRMAALRDKRVTASSTETEEPDEESDEDAEEETEDADEVADKPAEPTQTASAGTTTRARVAARSVRPVVPAKPARRTTIIASADVPGFSTGSAIEDLSTVGEAVVGRAQAFPPPAGLPNGQMTRYPVAQFKRPFEADQITNGGGNDTEVVDRAGTESLLAGGSLVAAGGWCAPSETLYDLCAGESNEGTLSLPEVSVSRGGIRFTQGPSFQDIYDDTGFCQTEAQAIAGTAKGCYTVPCPPFQDVRLDACGICIRVPLLTNAGYPELLTRIISGALIAHQFKISNRMINGIKAAAKVVTVPDYGAVSGNALTTVEYLAEVIRQRYRLPASWSVEVVLPHWAKAALRADLAMRNGVDLLSVTDAQLSAYFTVRGVSVQYVYGLADLPALAETGATAGGFPATMPALVYPAGSFVKGTANVINLDAVYDAASLDVNLMTALFVEEGVLLANRCYGALTADIPVCSAGITGAASNAECWNAA